MKSGKLLFKILALPVMLVLGLIAKLVTNLSCYIVGPFMLFLGGCCVYAIVMQVWNQLAILAVLLLGCVVMLFGASWLIIFFEDMTSRMAGFIRS